MKIKINYEATINFQKVIVSSEIEMKDAKKALDDLKKLVIEELKDLDNKVNQLIPNKNTMLKNTQFKKGGNELFVSKGGNYIRSKDGIKLTNNDFKKCQKANIKPWIYLKSEIDNL